MPTIAGRVNTPEEGPPVSEIAPEVLGLLVCPQCHQQLSLDYEAAELICCNPACGLAFPVRQGIPILVTDAARKPER